MYLGVQHKIAAWLRTIVVFALLILILLYVHFRTPIPPYPEGGGGPGMGIEVNIGDLDEGLGDNLQSMPLDMPDFKNESKPKAEEEKILT